jgi:hypothetical protein
MFAGAEPKDAFTKYPCTELTVPPDCAITYVLDNVVCIMFAIVALP